jgi:hypothetical protein
VVKWDPGRRRSSRYLATRTYRNYDRGGGIDCLERGRAGVQGKCRGRKPGPTAKERFQ